MVITCLQSFEVAYKDKEGNVKKAILHPGSRDYPMLDHKDPMVAEQLRVLRKHSRIGFDEIIPDPVKPVEEKAKAVELLEKSAVVKHARRSKRTPKPAPEARDEGDKDQSGRTVSE